MLKTKMLNFLGVALTDEKIQHCCICNKEYAEEDLQVVNNKNVCSDCIFLAIKTDLENGLDTEKIINLTKTIDEQNKKI